LALGVVEYSTVVDLVLLDLPCFVDHQRAGELAAGGRDDDGVSGGQHDNSSSEGVHQECIWIRAQLSQVGRDGAGWMGCVLCLCFVLGIKFLNFQRR